MRCITHETHNVKNCIIKEHMYAHTNNQEVLEYKNVALTKNSKFDHDSIAGPLIKHISRENYIIPRPQIRHLPIGRVIDQGF